VIVGLAAVGAAAILTTGFGAYGRRGVLRTTTTTRATRIVPTTSAPTSSTTSTTSTPTTSTSSTTSAPTTSTTSTSTTAAATASLALPVVECPSHYGAGPAPPSKYPSTIAVSLPAAVSAQLSYYSDSTRSVLPILAPRGWNCSAGIGADGGVSVDVFPSDTFNNDPSSFKRSDAQGVLVDAIPGCQSCISGMACPLVPAAVEGSLSLYSPCPSRRPQAEEVQWAIGSPNTPASDYTYDLVYFTDPPGVAGDGDPSGGPFTARGVLLFTNGPDISTSAPLETCTLSTHLAGLCTPILNDFSIREGRLTTS